MSEQEASNTPLRELIRQNITMLEQHKKDSNDFRMKTTETLAEISVHGQYTKTRLESHEKSITDLEKTGQQQKGFLTALSFIGATFIIDFLRRIFQ